MTPSTHAALSLNIEHSLHTLNKHMYLLVQPRSIEILTRPGRQKGIFTVLVPYVYDYVYEYVRVRYDTATRTWIHPGEKGAIELLELSAYAVGGRGEGRRTIGPSKPSLQPRAKPIFSL